MRTSEGQTALIGAMVQARAAFGVVVKDATGAVGKDRPYKYADLASILEAVTPALAAQGLVLFQATDAETSTLVTRLAHTSGEWIESAYPLPAPTTPQAYGSALSFGRRYSIQALLCLAAVADDGSAAEHAKPAKAKAPPASPAKTINPAQIKVLFSVAEQAGWGHQQMREYLLREVGVERSQDIPAAAYDRLLLAFDHEPPSSAGDR